MSEQTQTFKIYGPLELPSGKMIHFRKSKGLDRSAVTSAVAIDDDNVVGSSMKVEELIRAKCVMKVDDVDVDQLKYRNLFDDWDDLDVEFYGQVFNEMFGMSEENRQKAKEAAAFLLKN